MSFKILVADDSITIQKIVAMAFESEEVVVEGIANGQAAFDFLSEFKPNIVLADIEMPGLNGFELSRKIKESDEFRSTQVLLLASDFEDFDEQKFMECKADDHISKPFKSDDIVHKVKSLLDEAPATAPEAPHPSEEPEEALEPAGEEESEEITFKEEETRSLIEEEFESILEETEAELKGAAGDQYYDLDSEEPNEEEPNETESSQEEGPHSETAEEETIQPELTEDSLVELYTDDLPGVKESLLEDPLLGSYLGKSIELEDESAEPEVVAEIREEIDSVPELPPEEENLHEDEGLLAEVSTRIEEPQVLDQIFRETVSGMERDPLGEESVQPEPENLLEEIAPDTFSPDQLNSKPDLIRETLESLGNLPPGLESPGTPTSAKKTHEPIKSPDTDTGNKKHDTIMEQHIVKVLEKSMDTSMRKEIGGLSDGIMETVREVVREIAPEIIRAVIQEEIDNIKKAEQV